MINAERRIHAEVAEKRITSAATIAGIIVEFQTVQQSYTDTNRWLAMAARPNDNHRSSNGARRRIQDPSQTCDKDESEFVGHGRLCASQAIADGARRGDQWHAFRGGTAGSSFLLIGSIGNCIRASNSHLYIPNSRIDGDQIGNMGGQNAAVRDEVSRNLLTLMSPPSGRGKGRRKRSLDRLREVILSELAVFYRWRCRSYLRCNEPPCSQK